MRISDWSSDVCSSDLRHGETVYRCDVSLPVRLQARGRRWPEGRRQRHGKITHRRKGRRLAPGERAADRRIALADTLHGEPEIAVLGVEEARQQRPRDGVLGQGAEARSEEHTSALQSLMRRSYAVICLKKKKIQP